ncbi:hypothetical protein NDN08_008053 [Rhodosorus marinus]|uniref:RRM domain-containing protein n=1 Tax=Rhodosorus marinus TaxID=101924 RepID=A0AAV8UZA0_9RHOD|nr:hypothetical protein NDN08_008053 [Rhodosorus marinus]
MGRHGGGEEVCSLHVSGYPADAVSSDDLREEFERYGKIADIYMPKDYHSRKPRGFAYVEFRHLDSAEEARRELDGTTQEFIGNGSSGLATTKTEKVGSNNRAFKSLLPPYKKVRCWKKLSFQISRLKMCVVPIGADVIATVTDPGQGLVVPPTEVARFPRNDRDLDHGPEVHFTIGLTARLGQD